MPLCPQEFKEVNINHSTVKYYLIIIQWADSYSHDADYFAYSKERHVWTDAHLRMKVTRSLAHLQELLVVYRHKQKTNWLNDLKTQFFGSPSDEEQGPRYLRRSPVLLRIFRDVPLPAWKIVFPDKLLQFRPLDGLRADLVTVSGKSWHEYLLLKIS